jgi:IS605 OrfB family transposase
MTYITLTVPFNVCCDVAKRFLSTAWLFKIATHRLLSVAKQSPVLPGTDIGWKSTFREIVYEVIPNRRYADGVIVLVRNIYESCRQLNINFRGVELSDWLMFQQSELEYPARNITLKTGYEFHITTIDYSKNTYRDIVKPTIPKSYRSLLDKILEERQEYTGRIVIKSYGTEEGNLWVQGEVQITIPIDFYYKHATRHKAGAGSLYGGVDVNVDRLNLAIIDGGGNLRDTYTFWFEEASRRGCSRRRARSIIGMRVHEMLEYAYHHGVKTLFLENPEVLGKLKLLWIRVGDRKNKNYNYKRSIFRSSVIEMIALKAPLYGIEVKYVDPRGTTNSREHDDVMRKYRLDKHTASAYLIALRGLRHQ